MKGILLLAFTLVVFSVNGQKKYFSQAIKNGRSSGTFYHVQINQGKAVKEDNIIKYASENNCIIRNITYQVANRFGDKFKGVKSFEFLPKSEIPKVIYETKFRGNVSFENLMRGTIGNVYFWMRENQMFKNFTNFYWTSTVSNGQVEGDGTGFYYNEKEGVAAFFAGRFSRGILQGNGSFKIYSFSDIINFDKGNLTTRTANLNNTFNDGMAVLTVDSRVGFISEGMAEGFYPKYRAVIQEFNNGKAVVLNDKNEEVIINKSGTFMAYTDKQNRIFEQRKREEAERIRIAKEATRKQMEEEYLVAMNSRNELDLFKFYNRYKNSNIEGARLRASSAYNLGEDLSEKYIQLYNDEVDFKGGSTLVKLYFNTIDHSPIILKLDMIFDFIDNAYSSTGINTWLTGKLTYGKKEKLFLGIREPVAYMDKAVVNAFWYREGTDREGAISYTQNSSFGAFIENVREFASNNGLKVQALYLGSRDADRARIEARRIAQERARQDACDQCFVDGYDVPEDGFFGRYSGEIKMKNGDTYSYDYDGHGGFKVYGGFLGLSSKPYPTMDSMIEALKYRCREKYDCR